MTLQHYVGPLTEENHYYPFGLTMAGISSKTFGRVDNKKKFNGYEENKTFDLNWLESFYRTYDPQLGRFWKLDPKPTDFESLYAAMGNNPIKNFDLLGDSLPPPTSDMYAFNPLSLVMYQGVANIKAEQVRTQYNKDAAKLRPDDKQGRADLKERTRAKTPEPFKGAIERGRPMAGEQAKVKDVNFKGNATKTNAEVNNISKTTGALGKLFVGANIVQSGVTIINSPTPVKTAVSEGAGWYGATVVGGEFAIWAAPAGPLASTIAGAVGGTIGFFFGKKGGEAFMSIQPAVSAGAKDFYDYNEKARQGTLDQNGWPLPIVCFVKGTLVYGNEGQLRPIQDIKIGDTISSFNFEKNKIQLSKVVNILNRKTLGIYEIAVGDETIEVTSEHPFYVVNKGWVKAGELTIGDSLKSASNNIIVKGVKKYDKTVIVYNIEVDGNHNFYVSKSLILVHNKSISDIK